MHTHPPPRCFLAPAAWAGEAVTLAPEESHHLLRVLRGRPGDPVTVFDGQGRRAPARIAAAGRNGAVRLQLDLAAAQLPPPPPVRCRAARR